MNELFICAACETVFKKGRSDQETLAEAKESPYLIEGQPTGLVCDDCFEAFKVWFATLTEEDHKRYRGEE